jgi:hypothetical protein
VAYDFVKKSVLSKFDQIYRIKEKFDTGHCYFLSFAKTHCLIVSLPQHTALLKMERLAHFFSKLAIPNNSAKLSVFGAAVYSGKYVTKL